MKRVVALLKHILLCVIVQTFSLKNETKSVIYTLSKHGIGSNIVNLLAYQKYFQDEGYTFIINESPTRYKYKGQGAIGAFFNIPNKIIGDKFELIHLEQKPNMQNAGKLKKRGELQQKYGVRGEEIYEILSKQACQSLKFNQDAEKAIFRVMRRSGLFNFPHQRTVGFHIRRGDKLDHESRKYEAEEYVTKLRSLEISDEIDVCFVASDDFAALAEMRKALLASRIPCLVKGVVKPTQHGNYEKSELSEDDVLELMTELYLLSISKYFIGTFNSNIGTLTALLRSCSDKIEKQHYSQSYGVDKDIFRWR